MLQFFNNILFFDKVITIIAAVSAILSWILSIITYKDIARIKRYIFLISISIWGISSGILLVLNFQLGAIVTTLLLGTNLLLGIKYPLLLNSIINSNTTVIVSKTAIYNLFCETTQRIILALINDSSFDGNDIRVSLFSVDWKSKELVIVGRYPIISKYIPKIKYKIGQGTSGVSAEFNRIIKVENLPSWNTNAEEYVKRLGEYNIGEEEINLFHIKSRCYYAFPIVDRDSDEGVDIVRVVIHVDSIHPTISSDNSSSKNWNKVIAAYLKNNRQLLFKTYIGKGL
jgi:hypothetical protein